MVWNLAVPANTFTDADGDTLTFSAKMKDGSPLPSWLTFNPSYNVGGAQGKLIGMPENAGVFNGAYEIRLTATDGVASVNADFVLYIGDASGLPLFVPIYDTQPKVTIYDCIAPAGAGTARVVIGLDKPARESVCWKITTQNGANSGNSGSTYTAKTQYVTFHAGEQYKYFDVSILIVMPTNRRVNIVSGGVGSNAGNTILRQTGYILTQAEADALALAGTPAVLPTGITIPAAVTLPPVPKNAAGWTTVFNPDLVGSSFEATNSGFSALDGTTPVWFSRPGSDADPLKGREQTGNSEDGYYTDPVVIPGTNPFPLVDIGGGVMKRALRAEYLDGMGGKPSSIASQYVNKTYTYTASMITTRKNFPTIQVGDYVEVRAKIASVLHTWPAIWMMPANPFIWPPEIDLMEAFFSSVNVDRINPTIHWTSSNKAYGSYFGYADLLGGTFDISAFHTWAVWVGPTWLVFYVDDVPFMMVPNMPLNVHGPRNWYLLLNIATGGVGSGVPDNPGSFPVDFILDYVKVWRKTA